MVKRIDSGARLPEFKSSSPAQELCGHERVTCLLSVSIYLKNGNGNNSILTSQHCVRFHRLAQKTAWSIISTSCGHSEAGHSRAPEAPGARGFLLWAHQKLS